MMHGNKRFNEIILSEFVNVQIILENVNGGYIYIYLLGI